MESGRGDALAQTLGADTLPVAPGSGSGPGSSPAPLRLAQLRPGMALSDRYTLTRQLGAGGMGEVWEGQHALIERPIALKFFAGSRADTDALKRFWREAKATAALHHEGIVDVLDFGVTDDGLPYIVMELLNGRPLSAALAEGGALPWPRVQALLLELTSALGHAHRRGIVHRDLKPSNIFLAREDDDPHERCKLIDFGIAKLTRPDVASTLETGSGMVLGTLAYMSPEQLGDRPLDTRSDIYSLGCVAYEMLTGRRPFEHTTPTGLVLQHLFNRPASPRRHIPEIPADIEAVVLRALCKDPNNRFQSMAEMREALLRVGSGAPPVHVPHEESTAGGPPTSAPDIVTREPPPPARRRAVLLSIVAAAAVATWWIARLMGHAPETIPARVDAAEPEPPPPVPATAVVPAIPEPAPTRPATGDPPAAADEPAVAGAPEISREQARSNRRRQAEPAPTATTPVPIPPDPPPVEPAAPKVEPPANDDSWERQRRLKSPFAPDDP